MTKWESNPELVPEECICAEDLDWDRAETLSSSSNFGEEQASLGLDRYSVGYDLPRLPPMGVVETANGVVGQAESEAQEPGGPVLDDSMEDMPGSPGVPAPVNGAASPGKARPASPDSEAEEGSSERSKNVAGPLP